MTPKPGDKIYVYTSLHISRGRDDFHGGVATVKEVTQGMSAGQMVPFVEVIENPGTRYSWEHLAEQQDRLRERFGEVLAHPDPDEDRPWIEAGDFVVDENGPHIHKGGPAW